MNIQHLIILLTFILFSFCQSSLAQSLNDLEVQKLLIENSTAQKTIEKTNSKLISENQNVFNSINTPTLDLTKNTNARSPVFRSAEPL